jgi:glycosyltransferase involved in cell wall biosynthesis
MTETIYVLCPDNNKPSGGIKILYRHVDVLNRSGFNSVVLHQQRGFRCTWFENTTRIAYLQDVALTARDFLVVPEVFGPHMFDLRRLPQIGTKVPKIVFNQNAYYTFIGHTVPTVLDSAFSNPYLSCSEFRGVIVVSDDSASYMRHAYPSLPVFRIHNAINSDVFSYRSAKKRQICFMPRKHPEDAIQVLGLLKARDALRGFDIVSIDNKREHEVATIMQDSLIFMSFGYPEGCPLPPAEAMSCGCVVVGYHGMGGAEYFDESFSFPVAINDIVSFSRTMEKLVTEADTDMARLLGLGRKASEFIRGRYSSGQEQADIIATWRTLVNRGDAV